MIWEAFQTAIVNRIKGDAYFTQQPAIGVFAEEDDAELTDDSLQKMRDAVQNSLNTSGVALVVSEPDYEITDTPDMYLVTTEVALFENRTANKKASTGARKSGRNAAAVVHWILGKHVITLTQILDGVEVPFEGFTPLKVRSGNSVGEEAGIKVRSLIIESKVMIEAVYACISTESLNELLVDENDRPLFVSPTEP